MGFWGALFQIGMELASAALGGGTTTQRDTLNKGWSGRIYGSEWPRCRGRVRLTGVPIMATPIVTTVHKLSSGGIFGLGQHTSYYNTYSISYMLAFGKKLGHGPAIRFLRLFADNKLLFNSIPSTATLVWDSSDPLSVSFATNQDSGSTTVTVTLGSGASLSASAGDLIQFNEFPNVIYQLQAAVAASGPGTVVLSIWPPLANELLQTVGSQDPSPVLSFPGATASPWDLSSFDPDPHDGSHVVGPTVPPGYVSFYLGDDVQLPDPLFEGINGAGNVPGYRGLAYCTIAYLQLANYGNHPPRIEAEIEFDEATDNNLQVGPFPGVSLLPGGGGQVALLLPIPLAPDLSHVNPFTILPYMWAVTQSGGVTTIYKINVKENTVVSQISYADFGGITSSYVCDKDGFIYFVSDGWTLYKFDGQEMKMSLTSPIGMVSELQVWDVQTSLFGNPAFAKLLAAIGTFGGLTIWDRDVLHPLGILNVSSSTTCVLFYTKSGIPITGPGNPITGPTPFLGLGTTSQNMIPDAKGNFWFYLGGSLFRYLAVPLSGIYVNPQTFEVSEVLYPPTLDLTIIDVSVTGTGAAAIIYSPADNSMICVGGSGIVKVSCDSLQIIQTNPSSPTNSPTLCSYVVDGIGSFVFTNDLSNQVWRYSAATLQQIAVYNMGDWTGGGGEQSYDGLVDTLWVNHSGSLYRLYLDRADPSSGIPLDNVLGTVMKESGYGPSLYDASSLALLAVGGLSVKREPHEATVKMLMDLYQFDEAEIDGQMVFLTRPQLPAIIVPEIDLGAVTDPSKKEARIQEVLTDELTVPLSVWIHYSDFLRYDQESTQYAKRISKPYSSSLSAFQVVTDSIEKLDMTVPIFDTAIPMKQRAKWILWEHWANRYQRTFKTAGLKYARFGPSDVVLVQYKGDFLETRLMMRDRGVGFALQFEGTSQDQNVYTPSSLSTSSLAGGGAGGGTLGGNPGISHDNYILTPPYPLSQTSTTSLALAATVATFDDDSRTSYNARPTIPIADPGAGNIQLYYVTIYDPTFVGEVPGTNSLTMLVGITPASVHLGETGYINMGSYNAAGTGATGGNGGTGGQPPSGSGVLVAEVAFGPTMRGPFQFAHQVSPPPTAAEIVVTSPMGVVTFQKVRFDAVNVYLDASDDNLNGFVEFYR